MLQPKGSKHNSQHGQSRFSNDEREYGQDSQTREFWLGV